MRNPAKGMPAASSVVHAGFGANSDRGWDVGSRNGWEVGFAASGWEVGVAANGWEVGFI
jgi:hypothetical protein